MTEPSLIDRRGKSFRQFQARPSWMGDTDHSDALLERLRLEKKSLRNQRVKPNPVWRWLKDRWLWLRWFTWQ